MTRPSALTLGVITSRVKIFGACKLRLKAPHSIYQKVGRAAIAEFVIVVALWIIYMI